MNIRWRSVVCGSVICLAWTAPCRASDASAALLACRNVADAVTRLACFDRESAALSRAPAAPAAAPPVAATPSAAMPGAPASAAATAAPVTAAAATAAATTATHPAPPLLSAEQKFGLPERSVAAQEVAAGTRAADANKVEAHLAGVAPRADGHTVFTLDNGQVWQDLLLEGGLLAKQGDAVTISRGMLGSYWLQIKSGRGCKVTRLR